MAFKNLIWCLGGILLLGLAVPAVVQAAGTGQVRFQEGLLTVHVRQVPFTKVLADIAEQTGIAINIDAGMEQASITAALDRVPLEQALKSLLREYSYAATYFKDGPDIRLAILNIYPRGQKTGEMIPVAASSGTGKASDRFRTVLVARGEELAEIRPDSIRFAGNGAILQPGRYAEKLAGGRYEITARLLEEQEREVFEEINSLRAEITDTKSTEKREALSLALLDRLDEFDTLQRTNRNKVESLYRIELFNSTKNQTRPMKTGGSDN